jgi:hypothetical protein
MLLAHGADLMAQDAVRALCWLSFMTAVLFFRFLNCLSPAASLPCMSVLCTSIIMLQKFICFRLVALQCKRNKRDFRHPGCEAQHGKQFAAAALLSAGTFWRA